MTPLECAARALAENFKAQSDRLGFVATDAGRYPVLDGCFDMQEAARAVLEVIREPSEAVRKALRENLPVTGYDWEYNDRIVHDSKVIDDEPGDCWRAMIDAALAEQV